MGWELARETSTRLEPAVLPFCSSQIPLNLTWDQTRPLEFLLLYYSATNVRMKAEYSHLHESAASCAPTAAQKPSVRTFAVSQLQDLTTRPGNPHMSRRLARRGPRVGVVCETLFYAPRKQSQFLAAISFIPATLSKLQVSCATLSQWIIHDRIPLTKGTDWSSYNLNLSTHRESWNGTTK